LAREVALTLNPSPSRGEGLSAAEGQGTGDIHGVTDAVQRARLRAELDGIIAHLYGLTEEEFAHILATFPLVSESVKVAALSAYRDVSVGALG